MGTTSTDNKIEKIKERVQKLLNQAADQKGTAEGEVFYQKAFDLMAAYGFEERDLDNPDADDAVIHREFTFSGTYTDMQARLLSDLASALHCRSFRGVASNSPRVPSATVFGVKRHVDRVEMLFSMLYPQMAAGAMRVYGEPEYGLSTVVARRSYMTGFSATIFERLYSSETTVAQGRGRYALALLDDEDKAQNALDVYVEEQGIFFVSRKSKRGFDGGAYMRGMDDGKLSDLGQTRVKARPALPC